MLRDKKVMSRIKKFFMVSVFSKSKFDFLTEYNSIDFRNILVLIALFTSLKYLQMEVKDKNAEIQELNLKLEKSKKEI